MTNYAGEFLTTTLQIAGESTLTNPVLLWQRDNAALPTLSDPDDGPDHTSPPKTVSGVEAVGASSWSPPSLTRILNTFFRLCSYYFATRMSR